MGRMFPQYPDSEYREPTRGEKLRDVAVMVVVLGVFAMMAIYGSLFFGG